MSDGPTVLWLTPDKPENISVGRQRIAVELEASGVDVTLRGTTLRTVVHSLREIGRYDAVIGTTRAGALAGIAVKLIHRQPLIVDHVDPIRQFETTHPGWLARIVRVLENVSFTLADHVLYVYEEEADRVTKYAGSRTKTDLGVDFDRFADPDPVVVRMAADHVDSLDTADDIVVYVGGLEPIYHISELLEAMDLLDDWTLLVLGEGSLSETVSEAAASRDDVVYLGSVPYDEVPGYLQAADVGVSLVDDPHTLKVLEYGAAGLAVVQAAGHAEARYGARLEYCDVAPQSIADAIQSVEPDSKASRLSSYAEEFRWSDIAENYLAVIQDVCE